MPIDLVPLTHHTACSRSSMAISILACHARDQGSNPGYGDASFLPT